MDETTVFSMRISRTLLEKIKVLADADKRTAAKEVEYIVEKYLSERPDP